VEIPQVLKKFVGHDAPEKTRLMAAKGMVPLKPEDLLVALYFLSSDPLSEVQEAAHKAVHELPVPLASSTIPKIEAPEVLDFYAKAGLPDEVIERIITSKRVSDETLMHIGRTGGRMLVDIVSQNQERLIDNPKITTALLENPKMDIDIRARVIEFRHIFLGIKDDHPPAPAAKTATLAEAGDDVEMLELDDDAISEARPGSEEFVDMDFPEEFMSEPAGEEEGEEKIDLMELAKTNIYAAIAKMNIAQKMRLASLGNKSCRALLVRDPNRLVSMSVMKNPQITETEIEAFAGDKNVDPFVLGSIGLSKSYSKTYGVRLALVNNPKAPLDIGMKFLNTLMPSDQKDVSRNKNASAAIRGAARRIIQLREEEERRKKEKAQKK